MPRRLVPAIAVIVVAAVAAVVYTQQTRPGSQERPGIVNFTQVDPVIACAGATETSALDGLKADGFKSIVNLRLASERGANVDENRARAEALGLNYIHIPVDGSNLDPRSIDQFLEAVQRPENTPMYLHCGSASRVGAMMIAKRVLVDGWDVDKAVEEARMIGMRGDALEKFARDYITNHKGQGD
jgi:uncharacterized protein (TIGR01244 family)